MLRYLTIMIPRTEPLLWSSKTLPDPFGIRLIEILKQNDTDLQMSTWHKVQQVHFFMAVASRGSKGAVAPHSLVLIEFKTQRFVLIMLLAVEWNVTFTWGSDCWLQFLQWPSGKLTSCTQRSHIAGLYCKLNFDTVMNLGQCAEYCWYYYGFTEKFHFCFSNESEYSSNRMWLK